MIHPDSRTLVWIEKVAKENNVKDIALAEKAIRAFSLLEALVRSGCPLLFKGGTAEMLHLNSAKRLSIDVDINPAFAAKNRCEKTARIFFCSSK